MGFDTVNLHRPTSITEVLAIAARSPASSLTAIGCAVVARLGGGSDGLAMVPLSEWPESGYMCHLASQPAASALMRVPSALMRVACSVVPVHYE